VFIWFNSAKLYLRSPRHVSEVLADRSSRRPFSAFRFTTRQIEPFINEVDAIAAALVIDGSVHLVDVHEDET